MRPGIAGRGGESLRKTVLEVELQAVVAGDAAVGVGLGVAAKLRIEPEAVAVSKETERLLVEVVGSGQVRRAIADIGHGEGRLADLLLQLQVPLLNHGGLIVRQLGDDAYVLRIVDVYGAARSRQRRCCLRVVIAAERGLSGEGYAIAVVGGIA